MCERMGVKASNGSQLQSMKKLSYVRSGESRLRYIDEDHLT
jgi:hypothetical protein